MSEDPGKSSLIQFHAFGELTEEQKTELALFSLDDPELFEELWEAEGIRQALEDPAARGRLLRSLNQETTVQRSFWGWLRQPAARFALAGAFLIVIGLVVWRGVLDRTPRGAANFRPATVETGSVVEVAPLFNLPVRDELGLRINLAVGTFRVGETVRATVQLSEPAAVFVIRRQMDGQVRVVYPTELAAPADLPAGETQIVFDPVNPTTELTGRQRVTVRVIALPAGTDLRTQRLDWAKLGRYSIRELVYDVAP